MSCTFYQKIDSLVSSLSESYQDPALSNITSMDLEPLPNRDEVVEITNLLREVLFPGHFGKQNLASPTVRYQTGDLLVNIYERLYRQIHRALLRRNSKEGLRADAPRLADEIVCQFLRKLPDIRGILSTDVEAAFDGDPSAQDMDEIIFSFPGLFAVSVYRLAHELHRLGTPSIPRIMTEYAHSVTGIDIHAGSVIGSHFFIDHGTGVVIGETTVIGSHVKLYQGVTLGALSTRGGQSLRGSKRHPTLEDDVTVYSGASILGGETVIGRGVVIGSNVFITQSVAGATKVSMKNQELLYKGSAPKEFIPDWVI